jgi:hypothetical protein
MDESTKYLEVEIAAIEAKIGETQELLKDPNLGPTLQKRLKSSNKTLTQCLWRLVKAWGETRPKYGLMIYCACTPDLLPLRAGKQSFWMRESSK